MKSQFLTFQFTSIDMGAAEWFTKMQLKFYSSTGCLYIVGLNCLSLHDRDRSIALSDYH